MRDDKYMKVKGNRFISYIFTPYLERYDADVYSAAYVHDWKKILEEDIKSFP